MFFLTRFDLNKIINNINSDLDNLCKYFRDNTMVVETKKSEFITSNKNCSSTYDDNATVMINNTYLEQVTKLKHLKLAIDKNLNMHCYVQNLAGKMSK